VSSIPWKLSTSIEHLRQYSTFTLQKHLLLAGKDVLLVFKPQENVEEEEEEEAEAEEIGSRRRKKKEEEEEEEGRRA
jgi:hypothetical protein